MWIVRALVSCMFLLGGGAFAATYYVSPTGNDNNDGLDSTSAWASIDNGDTKGLLTAGDTVNVLPGTYLVTGSAVLTTDGTAADTIVYRRLGDTPAILDAVDQDFIIIDIQGDYAAVQGLELTKTAQDAIYVEANNCRIEECYIHNIDLHGINVRGDDNLILRNVITHCGFPGLRNEIQGAGNLYYGNTIYGCGWSGVQLLDNGNSRLFNNIVVLNGLNGIEGKAGHVCAFNDVWSNSQFDYAGCFDSAGGISADPLFVDSSAGDFGLQPGSPCINAGLDRGYSYYGSAPEIGAIEYANAAPTTYWVSPTGNDNNDGLDSTTAWASIDNGDNKGLLQPGDTINIMAGTYLPTDSIVLVSNGTATSNIVYRAYSGSGTSVINGNGQAITLLTPTGDHVTIDGLYLSNTSDPGGNRVGLHVYGDSCTIQNCRLDSVGAYGIRNHGTGNLFLYNIINKAERSGVFDYNDARASRYHHNTVYGCGSSGFVLWADDGATEVTNCIIAQNGLNGIEGGGEPHQLTYNDVWGNFQLDYLGGAVAGEGSISVVPLFTDSAGGDFNLQLGSECIDAGTDLGYPYEGSAPTMGAIEYAPSGANQPPVLAPIGPKTVDEGQNLNFGVSATDAESTPNLSTSSLPSAASFIDNGDGTGTFDWTPIYSQSGSYNVTFYATDDSSAVDSEGVSITVNNVHQPPMLAAIGPKSVEEGQNMNFGVSASDPDGTTPTLIAEDVPSNASFVDNGDGTGTFDFNPDFTQADVYNVRFIASDGALADSEAVAITVTPGPITYIDVIPASAIVEELTSLQFAAQGFDAGSTFVRDLTDSVNWSTTDPAGSITAGGLYTAGAILSPPDYFEKAVYQGSMSDSASVTVLSTGILDYVRIEWFDGTSFGDTTLTTDNDTTTLYCRGYDSGGSLLGDVSANWSLIGLDGIGGLSPSGGTSTTLELFNAGTIEIVANKGPTIADTTGIITCVPGAPALLVISPDTATISADSDLVFTATSYDADQNLSDPQVIPVWSVTGVTGTIDSAGHFFPEQAGNAYIVATGAGLIDTTGIINVVPGEAAILEIQPDSAIVHIGDTVQYTAAGYDAKGNETNVGTLTWRTGGRIGTIGSNGLFIAGSPGSGLVQATSSLGGLADTTGLLEIQELYLTTLSIGNSMLIPGGDPTSILSFNIANFYDTPKTITLLEVRDRSVGPGTQSQLLDNLALCAVYLDVDKDSLMSPLDSLLGEVDYTDTTNLIPIIPVTIQAGTSETFLVAVTASLTARDGDTVDLALYPATDIESADATPVVGPAVANSLGQGFIDGLTAAQVQLIPLGSGTLDSPDSVYLAMAFDIPRNGYQADVLNSLRCRNLGTAGPGDIGSLTLFRDNGNGVWDGAAIEAEISELIHTGLDWVTTGLTLPLNGLTTRFYLGAQLDAYPVDGTTLLLQLPLNALEMESGNDGPIDEALGPVDTFTVVSVAGVAIQSIPVASSDLIPGSISEAVQAISIINTMAAPIMLDSITFTLSWLNTGGTSQLTLDSQVDSLLVYFAVSQSQLFDGASGTLVGVGYVSTGIATVAVGGLSIPASGGRIYLRAEMAMSEMAHDGNRLSLSIETTDYIAFTPGMSATGDYPIKNADPFTVNAFPASLITVSPPATTILFGKDKNAHVFDFTIPANGYSADTINTVTVVNRGTVIDGDVFDAMYLYSDLGTPGFGAEDSLLGEMSFVSDIWTISDLEYPVPLEGSRFHITVDVSDGPFEGSTLQLSVPEGGLIYASGMNGPDDSPAMSDESILVFPPNHVTAVSIPLGTSSIYPSSSGNNLFAFALYNGYLGQSRHLNRVTLTNATITRSSGSWADQEVGQIQLYFDDNRNRVLDGDSLIGSGFFADGGLTFSGMSVEIPPESLSYFFVTAGCPLNAIDGDSLAAAVDRASDFGFVEPVNLNGDLPLTRGGYLIIDGSIAEQYSVFPIPSRSLSLGDSNIVLFAFQPPTNGDQVDTLKDLTLGNFLDATNADFTEMRLWADLNADHQWQLTDSLIGTFSYLAGFWTALGVNYTIDTSSPPLIVTSIVSDTAGSNRAFRGYLPVNGCEFMSDNDGPIDESIASNATFVISSSALQVTYGDLRTAYSVGESIPVTLDVSNLLMIPLDSIYSQVIPIGDTAAVVLDSSISGPTSIDADSSAAFAHYYTAIQPGTLIWQSRAIAPTIADTSAVIETDETLIQSVPSGLIVSLNSFMPTAVTRGQQNVFPLSLELSHADLSDAAPIRIKAIIISTLDDNGTPQPAAEVLSRLLLADDNSTLSVLTAIPDSANVRLDLDPDLILRPADTAELVLLMDIADSASATSLIIGIESIEAIDAVDANTDSDVVVMPSSVLPLRTASCRVDNPATTLAISNVSQPLPGVNAGQDNVQLLRVGLRHPGTTGMSQVQLVGLSLIVVSGADTLIGSSVADRIAVYRSTELLGEVTGPLLDDKLITIDLGSGLTMNPNARDSLFIALSVAPGIVNDSFLVIIPDSSAFEIRDVVSGSEVTAVTDQDILATGSVFPLASSTVRVYQASEDISYCLSDRLPTSLVAGADTVSLISLNLTYGQTPNYAPVRISSVAILLLDSAGIVLDAGQLFDRTGYRIATDAVQYYTTVTHINGATLFALSDTGIILSPSTSLDIDLIADIESDSPYDNFRIVLDGAGTIGLHDAIDSTHHPALTAAMSCDTTLPYQSRVTSVFMPAGAPRFNPGESSVRIASQDQQGLVIGGGSFSYVGGVQQGDIEFTSLRAVLFKRDGTSEVRVPVSDIFSNVYLLHGENQIAVDSVLSTDTMSFFVDPPLSLAHGTAEDISLVGDIRPDAGPGSYIIKIMDSTAFILRDKNLGTAIFPVLATGDYPATLGTISLSPADLGSSFSNYPNPFIPANGPTTITYVLPEDANVDIELFTITGDPVARIAMNEFRPAGPHQDQTWNGLNESGLKVVPGTYFCRITARYQSGGTETARRKVSVVR